MTEIGAEGSSGGVGNSSDDLGLAGRGICGGFGGGGDVLVGRALGRAVLLEVDLAGPFGGGVVVLVLFAFH